MIDNKVMKKYNVIAEDANCNEIRLFIDTDETTLKKFLAEYCETDESTISKFDPNYRWLKDHELPEYDIPYRAQGWIVRFCEA